jgi:hypothetical protein
MRQLRRRKPREQADQKGAAQQRQKRMEPRLDDQRDGGGDSQHRREDESHVLGHHAASGEGCRSGPGARNGRLAITFMSSPWSAWVRFCVTFGLVMPKSCITDDRANKAEKQRLTSEQRRNIQGLSNHIGPSYRSSMIGRGLHGTQEGLAGKPGERTWQEEA